MNRMGYLWWKAIAVAALLAAMAGAQQTQSLGDYARTIRKDKAQKAPAAKHFDNDNLPAEEHISVIGAAPPADGTAKTGDSTQANAVQAPDDKKADAQKDGTGDRQAMWQDWQKKIKEQKDAIDLLSRELDVVQREYRLRAAAMYADVGNRLRNSAQWDKEDAEYKKKIADKQKAVDDAKEKLENMQEEARKAGVPSSMRE